MNQQMIYENPFQKGLSKLRWVTFWCLISAIVFFAAVDVWFAIPEYQNTADILGDLYLLYMVVLTLAAMSFMGLFFFAGMMTQVWLLKKAVDKQLDQLAIILKSQEDPEFKVLLEEKLKNAQKPEDKAE